MRVKPNRKGISLNGSLVPDDGIEVDDKLGCELCASGWTEIKKERKPEPSKAKAKDKKEESK